MGRARGLLIGLGLLLGLGGCHQTVLEGLAEAEANELLLALHEAGIHGDKTPRGGRFSVQVERPVFAEAWQVARARGLPRPAAPRTGGLLPSEADRAAAARRAVEVALGEVLRADPAVVDARVVLGPAGAAVALRIAEGAAPPGPERVGAQVRAVAGLAADAPVAVSSHAVPPAIRLPSAPRRSRLPLWLASAAVLAMAGGCGLMWWKAARGRP